MASMLLDSLLEVDINGQKNIPPSPQGVEAVIFSISSDLHTILREAMTTAKAIFLQKSATPKKGTPPLHLWPKSVQQDVDKIRRRVKTLRRLAILVAHHPEDITYDTFLYDAMWSEVITPFPIRSELSPPPIDLASLGILQRKDFMAVGDIAPSHIHT